MYEDKIQYMGNPGHNGGEYYTPCPLIRTIIKGIKPVIGNRIYDGRAGSAGFLAEVFDYLKESRGDKMSVKDMQILQTKNLFSKEKKPLPYERFFVDKHKKKTALFQNGFLLKSAPNKHRTFDERVSIIVYHSFIISFSTRQYYFCTLPSSSFTSA